MRITLNTKIAAASCVAALAFTGAVLLWAGPALARCGLVQEEEELQLELLAVEVDGVLQDDTSAYDGFDVRLFAHPVHPRSIVLEVTDSTGTVVSEGVHHAASR